MTGSCDPASSFSDTPFVAVAEEPAFERLRACSIDASFADIEARSAREAGVGFEVVDFPKVSSP